MHDRRTHRSHDREPNLLDSPPRNVWLEVYNGRWTGLRRIQKIEFVVEVVFFVLFIGGFTYVAYIRNGNVVGLVLALGLVGCVLGGFFFLLSRDIR